MLYSFPRREDVERSNTTRMNRLDTTEKVFTATDGGTIPDGEQRQKMLTNFMAPQLLVLRVDAQVMLIKNVDETLVNGSMGRVVRFVDPAVYGTEIAEDVAEGGVIGGGTTASAAGGANASAAKKPKGSPDKMYPVVDFVLPRGNKRRILVLPEVWKVELPSGEIQVSRGQVSLMLLFLRYIS